MVVLLHLTWQHAWRVAPVYHMFTKGRILNWLVSVGILQLPAVHVKITAMFLVGMTFLDVMFFFWRS